MSLRCEILVKIIRAECRDVCVLFLNGTEEEKKVKILTTLKLGKGYIGIHAVIFIYSAHLKFFI